MISQDILSELFLQNGCCTREDLVQIVMKRKLTLFGHIARMNDKRKIKTT